MLVVSGFLNHDFCFVQDRHFHIYFSCLCVKEYQHIFFLAPGRKCMSSNPTATGLFCYVRGGGPVASPTTAPQLQVPHPTATACPPTWLQLDFCFVGGGGGRGGGPVACPTLGMQLQVSDLGLQLQMSSRTTPACCPDAC